MTHFLIFFLMGLGAGSIARSAQPTFRSKPGTWRRVWVLAMVEACGGTLYSHMLRLDTLSVLFTAAGVLIVMSLVRRFARHRLLV